MEDEKKSVARKELEGLLAKAKDASGTLKDGYLLDTEGKGKRILELVRTELNLSWPEVLALLKRSKTTIEKAFSHYGIGKKRAKHIDWTQERIDLVEQFYKKSQDIRTRNDSVALRQEMTGAVNALPGEKVTLNAIRLMARDYDWGKWGWGTQMASRSVPSGTKMGVPSKEELLEDLPLEMRQWDNPLVLESDEAGRKKPGIRIGFISGIAYPSAGYSAGLIEIALRRCAEEGTVYNCLVGHLTDRKELTGQAASEAMRHPIAGVPKKKVKARFTAHAVNEAARALSALIPKVLLPRSGWDKDKEGKEVPTYVRLYISTSPNQQYDGAEGEDVARALHTIRPEDIRLYDPGFDRVEVQGMPFEIGIISPSKKARLPGRYVSTKPETLIEEQKAVLFTKKRPQFWAVGAHAGAVYTPSGIHKEPYVILPVLRRLLETRLSSAENQVGLTVFDIRSPKEVIVHFWSYGDLLKDERKLISAPRGASATQKRIVEILNETSPRPFGRIAATLEAEGVTRLKADEEIKGLLVENPTAQKNWPGLFYDEPSGRYGFNQQWIQERMRYVEPRVLLRDHMLFFGCLHAGYVTTDYKHFVTVYPKVILANGVTHLFALGDLTAGLHHGFHESGEVFGGMNYTDQEYFAAELVATVIFRVFAERLTQALVNQKKKKLSSSDATAIAETCLLNFVFIPGNHDLWQEKDAHSPLHIFYLHLLGLLAKHINTKLFAELALPPFDVFALVKKHIFRYRDFEAVYTLPSGIKVAMQHPHMGGAQTTTLRAQKALGLFDCQVSAVANFHAATIVHQWQPSLGQCVAVQAGTQVIYTRFERRKMKSEVDFGPILLCVGSANKRIVETACGYYNEPFLSKELSKNTDLAVLKDKHHLNLLT